jgi:hypothetical protein
MTRAHLRDQFVTLYNENADDIFAYCYDSVANRDIAKYLTRNIFMRTWDAVSSAGESVINIQQALFSTAKEHIDTFILNRHKEINHTENLWNLTLAQ